MRTIVALAAMICVFIALSAVQPGDAAPVDQTGLDILCKCKGCVYSPPNNNGISYCVFPDGTVMSCNSNTDKCSTIARSRKENLLEEAIMKILGTILDDQQRLLAALGTLRTELDNIRVKVDGLSVSGAPDLVPVPITGAGVPISTDPAGFCRFDVQGKLHVFVYNQAGAPAGPSVTQVFFRVPPGTPVQKSCGVGCAQVDVATSGLIAFHGTEGVAIDIPEGCFGSVFGPDDLNFCLFKINVDGTNLLNESNELNNTALGGCQGLL